MWECVITLEEVKRRLIPDMFSSEEDGNPDDYDINICDGGDTVLVKIVRKPKLKDVLK